MSDELPLDEETFVRQIIVETHELKELI
jgi:hypothetical protein